jgi:hypothetical protein
MVFEFVFRKKKSGSLCDTVLNVTLITVEVLGLSRAGLLFLKFSRFKLQTQNINFAEYLPLHKCSGSKIRSSFNFQHSSSLSEQWHMWLLCAS